MKKFGHCLECNRLLPIKFLQRVEYYDGHLINGAMHHKLLCDSCMEKAEEVFEEKYFKEHPNG